jgi:hypothetical protein
MAILTFRSISSAALTQNWVWGGEEVYPFVNLRRRPPHQHNFLTVVLFHCYDALANNATYIAYYAIIL